jgi:hypothetical protein
LPALSEWLQLMLGEIARKREELEHARAEEHRREREDVTEDRDAAQARGDQSTLPGQELAERDEAARAERMEHDGARAARR